MLREAATVLLGGYAVLYALRSYSVNLEHFSPAEFGVWWPRMDVDLLRALDAYRDALGAPLEISPATGALGRALGDGNASQHNVARWGEVRAADVLVPEGMTLRQAYEIARGLELFSGIGVYPDWYPRPGLHLDTRRDRSPSDPALWAGRSTDKGQVYVALQYGFTDRLPPGALA